MLANLAASRSAPPATAPASAAPAIPEGLVQVESLAAWIGRECGGDPVVAHVCLTGDVAAGSAFPLLELSEARVEGCRFPGCDFSRAVFADVAFSSCDFSNADFSEANFTRCTFASCKFTGAGMSLAVLRRVEVRDSTFAYASLERARLEDFSARASDFSHADIAEARFKRVAFDDVRFSGTSFFRTGLAGIDFTTCQLSDIVLSDAMGELHGCVLDLYQAAGIARRLGVTVRD